MITNRQSKKVKTLSEVVALAKKARRSGKTVVTTNGCFDIVHVGHVRYLEEAKRAGDILIVGINSDSSVKKIKGPSRPIVSERERAEVIASLKPVDAVFIFREPDPRAWLKKVRPHIHAKGGDRTMPEIIEKDTVEKNGGKVAILTFEKGRSTTKILEKIKKSSSKKK